MNREERRRELKPKNTTPAKAPGHNFHQWSAKSQDGDVFAFWVFRGSFWQGVVGVNHKNKRDLVLVF